MFNGQKHIGTESVKNSVVEICDFSFVFILQPLPLKLLCCSAAHTHEMTLLFTQGIRTKSLLLALLRWLPVCCAGLGCAVLCCSVLCCSVLCCVYWTVVFCPFLHCSALCMLYSAVRYCSVPVLYCSVPVLTVL